MSRPKIIAFYLPQFHQIPENDIWWGKGFTDWTNVKKGKPRFAGHYQPHIPADLGYYDLSNEDVRIAQAQMAKQYGLGGFCYYHYWFNEKMLLEKPFNEVLQSGNPDFPFCLCWANENWTRRWDGCEHEVLIEQDYSKYDPVKHIKWLAKAFCDSRYIRINKKPIFLVYNAYSIPNLKDVIKTWRESIKNFGIDEIYICSVKSYHNNLNDEELINLGFDALVDFIPTPATLTDRKISSVPRYFVSRVVNKILNTIGIKTGIFLPSITSVFSYKKIANKMMNRPENNFRTYQCLIPHWDNSARRKQYSMVIQNDNANIYRKWLSKSIENIKNQSEDEQVIFINAWNEWAEGCHLEPDLRNGKKFLEATLEVLNKYGNK